jgi:hypothetical protein
MNTFQILSSKFRFDLIHWNVSIDPEKWPISGRFLTLFPLKRPVRAKKIPPIWRRPSVTSLMTSRASPLYSFAVRMAGGVDHLLHQILKLTTIETFLQGWSYIQQNSLATFLAIWESPLAILTER